MLSHWWVQDYWEASPILLVSWVFWVIASITLHELAHGWAALRQGDTTPVDTGHMSWNPVVHMGVPGLVMFAVAGIAFGAMPVNPSRFRSRHGDARVAFAGPAMNVVLALISFALLCGFMYVTRHWKEQLGIERHVFTNFYTFLVTGSVINLVLFAFNLLPIPPLDGSRIAASFIPRYREVAYDPRAFGPLLVVFILIFFWGGGFLFDKATDVVSWGLDHAVALMP